MSWHCKQKIKPEAFKPEKGETIKKVAEKYFDTLHCLMLLNKNKSKKYIYVVEYPAGNSTSRLMLRNKLKEYLPFKLQAQLAGGRIKLITLLFEEGLLTQFGDFTPEEQELLKVSIENHNKYRIPEGMSAEKTAYCNILRDADKIDIFRVNCDTPLEDIYNVSTAELKQAAVSDLVKKCFMEKHTVLRSLKHTPVDNLVGHVCLVFELVYPISIQIAKEQGYVDKLMRFASDNPDTNAWLSHMRKHLWSS